MKTHRLSRSVSYFISCMIATSTNVLAQNNENEALPLEELIVTAQKREESIGDVPVALSVLTSDQIEASFTSNLEQMQELIPSVSFRSGNTTRNSALTVRGIGTISFSIGAEPSVSTVVDGVVLGRSGQAFGDLYDLERVEVLRGPQGTLFGKNASAGVVNLVTKRPSDDFEGYVDLSMFQDDETRLKARISGPITDNVRGSLTIMDAEFDGYIENVFTNEMVNGYDREGVRGMLDIDVDDDTTALLIFEQYDAENDCCDDLVARQPNASRPLDPEVFPSVVDGLDLDQRKVDHDFVTTTLDSTDAISLQIDKQLGDYTLTSITSRRLWKNTEFREGDFTSENGDLALPVDFSTVGFQLHDVGPQEWRQFSQEIRIASPGDRALTWQAGAFFWNIDSVRNFTREASCQVTDDNLQIVADANATDPTLGLTCLQNDIVSATAFMQTEFENYAIFGQGSFAFTDALSLLFGLRYTEDEVSFKHNRTNNDEFGRRGVGVRQRALDTDFSGSTSDENTSGKLGLQFSFAESSMVYATASTGYKGPAFNVFYNMSENDLAPIDAETSSSVEVGYKYAGRSAFVSLVAYSTEIEDFQANDFDDSDGTTITGFTNGGDVETEGVELDVLWNVTSNFSVNGGIASSDAKTTNGFDLPFAPDLKYTLAFDLDFPLSSGAKLNLNSSYVYTDEKLSGNIGQTEETNPEVLLPDYGILNTSLSYYNANETFKLSLIAKNLTDESYATTYSGDGFRYQIPRDADRYFGVNAKFSF